MSRGGDTRFRKGESGNPKGRPKARRPHISAFDIIFDKALTVTQGGVERELTLDEALQLQTYQAALKGGKMAIRAILKMIEKRERAIAALAPSPPQSTFVVEHSAHNANRAALLLGIAEQREERTGSSVYAPAKLATWATQAAISRLGRRPPKKAARSEIEGFTWHPEELRWPDKRAR